MIDPEKKNDYFVRLSGKGNIPEPLNIGYNYNAMIQGTITSTTESDAHDGHHLITYKFEPVIVEMIDEKGKSIRAKDTRSLSQIFRSKVWKHWSRRTRTDVDDKIYYERLMERLIEHAEDICEMYGEDTVI